MNKFHALSLLAFACGSCLIQPVLAQDPAPPARRAPGEERINVNFRATPIEEVFDMLSRKDSINIILSRGVSGTVSVNLYNVTVREAIYRVAQAAGFWVEERDGAYVILGKETSLDYPGAHTQIKTFKVQYSDVKQVADIVSKYVSRQGKVTPLIGRKLIVVEDLPGFAERIARLLEELDVPPKQVLIEAKILEITLEDTERFGINWRRVFGGTTGTRGSIGTAGLAAGSAAAPPTGFFFSIMTDHAEAFFTALATKGRVRTLATPKLLALENQEAKTVIGDTLGYRVTTTINLVTSESIQFLESGVILKVTPSVDQRGRILMKVHPEISTASLSDGIPSKKSTEVTTELVCEDGQSIFIGGLIKAGSVFQREGVPVAQDLPLLGALFRNRSDSVTYTETVVMITPYIITEPRQADGISEERARRIQEADEVIEQHQRQLRRGSSDDGPVEQ
jgi:type II secretory pathway component GspD/PulD (secretin)